MAPAAGRPQRPCQRPHVLFLLLQFQKIRGFAFAIPGPQKLMEPMETGGLNTKISHSSSGSKTENQKSGNEKLGRMSGTKINYFPF